jgi:hypothetical protein
MLYAEVKRPPALLANKNEYQHRIPARPQQGNRGRMSKNTGIPYEILTQQIFQALHDQSQIKNIQVQQNVKLKGKTLEHQIDVYWEYELGGIVYCAVVQAKDWGQAVTQNQLLAFKAILDDLPGQPRGIFVTRTGYQIGARTYAEANGIKLYELREPTEKDVESRIMSFHMRVSVFSPKSSNIEPIFDQAWAVAERERRGFGPDEIVEIKAGGFEDQLFLLNEAGEKLGSFHSVIQSMFPPPYVELPVTAKEHLFTTPTYLSTGNVRFPRTKLLGIRATISVECQNQETILKGEDFVCFVMHDVISKETTLIDKKNRPLR